MNNKSIPAVINLSQVWTLDRQLASGGFGQVHEAHKDAGDRAAVKFIPQLPGYGREILFEELDGAKNVIPVLDRGEVDGYWVLVMPLAEKSLREHLDERGGRLAVSEAVPVLVDITEALVSVEDRVVHRDIKPENILFLDGHWQLADFGIAPHGRGRPALRPEISRRISSGASRRSGSRSRRHGRGIPPGPRLTYQPLHLGRVHSPDRRRAF